MVGDEAGIVVSTSVSILDEPISCLLWATNDTVLVLRGCASLGEHRVL